MTIPAPETLILKTQSLLASVGKPLAIRLRATIIGAAICLGAVVLLLGIAGCSVEARKARHLARGEEYFKAGDYEKAKIEYMKVLLADPGNELPFQRLGLIWSEEGAPLRAVPFLSKARDLSPNDIPNRLTLARMLMVLGRTEDARKEVLAVLELSPDEGEALILLADTDQTKKDLEYTEQFLQSRSTPESLSVLLGLANVAVQKGDFKSAATLLEKALALDGKSPLPHLAMANLHFFQKRLADAEQEFKAAAELAPIRSATRLRYAEFKIANGNGEDVKQFLKDLVRQAPDSLPAWCYLSQLALTSGQYEESLRTLENVFSRDPQNPEARILEAETLLAKGEIKKAVERFEQLERTYKDVPVINYELARAYLQNNNPGQASVALTHAIAAKPDYLEAILLRGELDLQTGNATLVVPSMTTLLEQRPHLRDAELLLTEAYLSLGQFDEAASVVRGQIRLSSDDADAYFRLGLVLREQKKVNESKAAFENVVKLVPGNLMAINQLVDLDLATKNFASAMLRVRDELQKQPGSGIVHFMEGKIYAAKGQYDTAEASLGKALELDPNSLGTYQLLISTYLQDNKPDEAITRLQNLLSLDPHQTWALSTLASIYGKTGDFEKARDTYETLLSETPESADTMAKLAVLYSEQFNQLSKAYDLAAKARSLAPVDPLVADTLGWISYKQGNYEQAINLIREAADKLPGNPEIQFHLGMANYMMDQPDAARIAFKNAVASERNFLHQEEAARWLAFLEDDSGTPKQFSIRELEALIELRPKDVIVRSRLAALYEKEGANAKAASLYESALSINPKLGDAAFKLAYLYAGPLHDLSKALEMAKTARDLNNGDLRSTRLLGKIAFATGNFAWSYNLLSDCSHQQKDDAGITYDMAWAAYSLGKVAEAQQNMRRVLELKANEQYSLEARRFLALTTFEQEHDSREDSSVEVQEALKKDPTYIPALMIKAAAEMRKHDSKKAVAIYKEVLQHFPDFAPAEKQLAALYMEDQVTLSTAYDLAVKARNVLQSDPELAQMLGEMSYRRSEYDYALQLLQESAKAKPLDAEALYYLGMSLFRTQQQAQGRLVLERSLAAGLQEPFASDAKQVLADLTAKSP